MLFRVVKTSKFLRKDVTVFPVFIREDYKSDEKALDRMEILAGGKINLTLLNFVVPK